MKYKLKSNRFVWVFFLFLTGFILLSSKNNINTIRKLLHIHCILNEPCNGQKIKTKKQQIKIKDNISTLLSLDGSTRATAYNDLNKIVELEKGFGIIWLNNEESKFRLKFRHFNEENISYIEYDLGEVYDNHGAGSIDITDKDLIHFAYYPHSNHHALYRTAEVENKKIKWSKAIKLGNHLTYPNIFSFNNEISIIARETVHAIGIDPRPRQIAYVKNSTKNGFSIAEILDRSELDGYFKYNFYSINDKKVEDILLGIKVVEGSNADKYGINQTIKILKIDNIINTKTILKKLSDEDYKIIYRLDGGLIKENSIDMGGLSQDNNNNIYVPIIVKELKDTKFNIVRIKDKKIKIFDISDYLTKDFPNYIFTEPIGGIAFDAQNYGYLVTTISKTKLQRDKKYIANWGSSDSAIYVLKFNPINGSKKCGVIINDDRKPVWLPHLKHVNNQLILMYTKGFPGRTNSENIKTSVYITNLLNYLKSEPKCL